MTYAFNPSQSEQSVLGQIRYEQSRDAYNILFGGGTFAGFAVFPQWAGKTFQGKETHASGAYQFEPATFAGAQKATGVPDFSPASQDIAALWLLRTYGQDSQWATSYSDNGYIYAFAAAQTDPLPSELTLTVTVPPTVTATDAQGNAYNVMIKLAAATLPTALVALFASWLAISPAAPPVEPQPDFFSSSTFRFEQSPTGLVAAPLDHR